MSLFEALRRRAPVRVCQVEIADRYDHKHQQLSADDVWSGLHEAGPQLLAAVGQRPEGPLSPHQHASWSFADHDA